MSEPERADEEWTLSDDYERAIYTAVIGAGDGKPRGLFAALEDEPET